MPRWLPASFSRHQQYTKALEAVGAQITMADFKERQRTCQSCGRTWTAHEEKETDVNVSVDLVDDLHRNTFDFAIVITADTDIRPAVQKVVEAPDKYVLVVAPPKRMGRARALRPRLEITPGRLAKNLFPQSVVDASGRPAATRPNSYDPPST